MNNDKSNLEKIEIESLSYDYLSEKVNRKFMPAVFRFNRKGSRYYFTLNNDNFDTVTEAFKKSKNDSVYNKYYSSQIKFFSSVTTIIKQTMPMSYGLQKLIGDLGMDGFNKMMTEKAHYGTLMHILVALMINEGKIRLNNIANVIIAYANTHGLDIDVAHYEYMLKKDIIAMANFFKDYQVTPLAVEVVGVYEDDNFRFAGAIDLIAELTIKEKGYFGEVYKTGDRKGEPKETYQERRAIALIDFKSGRNGFYDDYEVQLMMYKMIAKQSLGIDVELLFNVSPKDWETSGSYNIKNQTDSVSQERVDLLLATYFLDFKEPTSIIKFKDELLWDEDPANAFTFYPIREYLFEKLSNNYYL